MAERPVATNCRDCDYRDSPDERMYMEKVFGPYCTLLTSNLFKHLVNEPRVYAIIGHVDYDAHKQSAASRFKKIEKIRLSRTHVTLNGREHNDEGWHVTQLDNLGDDYFLHDTGRYLGVGSSSDAVWVFVKQDTKQSSVVDIIGQAAQNVISQSLNKPLSQFFDKDTRDKQLSQILKQASRAPLKVSQDLFRHAARMPLP